MYFFKLSLQGIALNSTVFLFKIINDTLLYVQKYILHNISLGQLHVANCRFILICIKFDMKDLFGITLG